MADEWRAVPGFEGLYEVSCSGKIDQLARKVRRKGRGVEAERVTLRTKPSRDGYCYVGLVKDGIVKRTTVHRVVALAFIPNPDGLDEVNHMDEDKSNNHVTNLEWCTRKYNANYGTNRERQVRTMLDNREKRKQNPLYAKVVSRGHLAM